MNLEAIYFIVAMMLSPVPGQASSANADIMVNSRLAQNPSGEIGHFDTYEACQENLIIRLEALTPATAQLIGEKLISMQCIGLAINKPGEKS